MSSELKFVSLQIFLCSLWFPWWKEEKADFHILFYFGSLGHQRMEQSHVCSGYRTFNMEPTTDKGGFKLSTFICVAWIFKLLWSTVCVCVMTVWNVFYPDLWLFQRRKQMERKKPLSLIIFQPGWTGSE